MSYKTDFTNDSGWSAVDCSTKLNTSKGKEFIDFLVDRNVRLIIRYYSKPTSWKALTLEEALLISSKGLKILPVFQMSNNQLHHFGSVNGEKDAHLARSAAMKMGQPLGTTILFAVDTDFSKSETKSEIIPYFKAINDEIGDEYKIGAYGCGMVLEMLTKEELIEVPWLSMSRKFTGTKEYFYSNNWAFRQIPPGSVHGPTQIGYDKNILNWEMDKLGAFVPEQAMLIASSGLQQDHSASQQTLVGSASSNQLIGHGGYQSPFSSDMSPGTAPNAYVRADGLNLRDAPNGNIIKELTLGDPVLDKGAAAVSGWRSVVVNGTSGYVFGKYLREPQSPEIEALVQLVIHEWVRFDKGNGNEKSDPYYKYVGQMWKKIGLNYDGKSVDQYGKDIPWSAAFISYVVLNSGSAYAAFKGAAAHSKFVHDAIQAKILGKIAKPFWGYKISEEQPQIGDIIHVNRGGNNYSFEFAETHSSYYSHADVVVDVTSSTVTVAGGNLSDTVKLGGAAQEYELDANGYLKPGQKIISLLKNRASQVDTFIGV